MRLLTLALIAFGFSAHAVIGEGIWIPKNEVEELHSTGKLQSLCEEIKRDPDVRILNIRKIDSSGAIYIYDPSIGAIPALKMGTVEASGIFTPAPSFEGQMGNGTVHVDVGGDVLKFTFSVAGSSFSMDYLRSSDEEVARYYAAEDACKNTEL